MLGVGLSVSSNSSAYEQGTKTYVYQSDFSADTDGWSDLFGNVTLSSGQTFQGESNVLKVTWSSGGASLLSVAHGTAQASTAYKLSFRFAYEDNTGQEPQQLVFAIRGSSNTGVQPVTDAEDNVVRRSPDVWFDSGELSLTTGSSSSSTLLLDTSGTDHPNTGDVVYITDVEIYYYS